MRGLNRIGGERGAITAITAISLVALFGAAALAIDIGVGWKARRNLVTTTDAAALAAAGAYASGTNGCPGVAEDYVSFNNAEATMTACDPVGNGTQGYVTVDAHEELEASFGRAVGFTNFDSESSSTAQWGPPSAATGLRPFGLCSEAPEMAGFLANPSVAQTIVIPYTKAVPDLCGGDDVAGNWGTIDFNGGANSQNDTKEWVRNGYPDEVFSGTNSGTCATESYACYQGKPGATTGTSNAVQDLVDSGIYFGLPIYNEAMTNGANAEYHFIGFARVRVIDFKFNGAESQRFLTLRFEPGILTGSCCNPGGTPTNAKAVAICAVDRNSFAGC